MIGELVSRCFATRNVAQIEHWKTTSYAAHTALGDFYDGIIINLDQIVEAYQGNFGVIKNLSAACKAPSRDIIKHLEEECEWLSDNRSNLAEDVEAIGSLVDNLSALYLSTIYKLRQLK